ncbi:MAG TPA: DUF4340 domain-containing protein [Myxococcaceae bacterium]|nr:DUF4340 domain-containing protein [Myxococcaceae bacterium]
MSARSKNLWTLLGAAVVAAGLGLYAWFGVMKGEEKAAEQKRVAERLVQPVSRPDGGTENVRYDRLVVKAKGETTELARLPDQSWVITRPLKTAADVQTAEGVVNALQFARIRATVEEKPTAEDLHRFGLDKPGVEVVASAEGVPPLTVRLGVENPYDGSAYLQREGDPKVYSVDGSTRSSLDKGTFDLRDRDVLAVRDLGITRIEVRGKKHDWAVGRDPGQPYAFLRPVKEDADTAAISGWLGSLRSTKATKYLQDTTAERKRTGVERPVVEARFQRGTTETVRVRLAAGKADADPLYVLREDQYGSVLAEVPRAALAALDRSPAELRDRSVLRAKPEDVRRIRIGSGDAALVVQRERPADGGPESWHVGGPTGAVADPFKASSLLYNLTSLRSEATEEKLPSDLKATGLGPTARTITFEGQDGKTLGSVTLGGTSRKPAGTFVRDDRGRLVVVDSARLRDLPSKPADLLPPPPPPAAPVGADAGS